MYKCRFFKIFKTIASYKKNVYIATKKKKKIVEVLYS